MNAARIAAGLALACSVSLGIGCVEPLAGPSGATDRASLFDDLWQQVDLHYSFFELKHIDWDSIGARYRPRALAATSDTAFADVLGRMLAELKDVHVSLTSTTAGVPDRYLSSADTAAAFFSAQLVSEHYVPQSRSTVGGHVRYGMPTPTVGYVFIRSFEGTSWANELDDALRELSGATSVVVDVRNNLGGTYTLASDMAGRFADRKRTFGYIRRRNGPAHDDFTDYLAETVQPSGPAQFHGPVYVLSNRRNFSTAEDFVLAMRALPNVTVVGERTAGASGGPIVRELANGWTYQVSEWIEYTPRRETFEGVGLAPDTLVKATVADAARNVDPILERALTIAANRARPNMVALPDVHRSPRQ
ncbi:MAG: S41 family peptidase [Gemmatimonadaceae bacterium]